ncbi:MAG: tetratricopeptide repeat protein [Candidatus Omnitrophica bacterium]|nr:tetratricopeptide repeat protein [Candidatus Omnitrophota bacterium]MDD5655364.1 tetratricopeptide repeat protein [Candidatus Omnitrophota bacterium]
MTPKILNKVIPGGLLIAGMLFIACGEVFCSDGQAKEQSAEGKSFIAEITELKTKNAQLEKSLAEAKKYNTQLEAKSKELHLKCADLEQELKNSSGLGKAVDNLNRERQILKDANRQLKEDLKKGKTENTKEKAELYQQLGTAYTKAGLFSLAIDAYNKALSINPRNAETHYNLGLLYRHSKNNSRKAIQHLKKYLQLNPDASNRKDVEYIIKMLAE